jgi:hypothetical protein
VAAVAACATLAAPGSAVASPARQAVPRQPVAITGTYRLMAKEVVEGRATGHAYDDLLVTPTRTYRLRLRESQRPKPGATVRISADTVSTSGREVTPSSIRTTASPSAAPLGPTRTLAILAYWTAPDSMTQAKASSQLFGDDSSWLREASYGQSSLSGSVTPWVKIAAPTSGRCYDYADQIMSRARVAANAIGYAYGTYDRTLVYFPRCSGSDTANLTGWAFEPGDSIWLNGVMDRRTSVHEHGHSFGMGHGRAYSCVSNGVRVTLGGTCTASEYGDPYDAMGQSAYVAHFTARHKEDAGWMGSRTRRLTTSSATVTLVPFERPSSLPLAVVVNSPFEGRRYWLEYRQALGYDARLPAGATAGVMIHLEDPSLGYGPYLLDPTPSDASFATAVLGAGRSWTAPDGVRVSVGTVSSTGATVTVTGARPEPVPPGVPRSVTAVGGDGRARVSWLPPASTGNSPITRYTVTCSDGRTQFLGGDGSAFEFAGLTNGATYSFTVRAMNVAGSGPVATVSATPRESRPTVAVRSPVPGSTISGITRISADVAPGLDSLADISAVSWHVDGAWQTWLDTYTPFTFDTTQWQNGSHTVRVTAWDTNGRSATQTVTYEFRNPRPSATITSPASGDRVTGGVVTVAVTAAPADDGVAVDRVELIGDYGNTIATDREAPYELPWDLTRVGDGQRGLQVRAVDTAGRSAVSAVVPVTVWHAAPTIALSPADGSTVRGTSITVTADVATGTAGVPISRVEFSGPTGYSYDYTAPYTLTFDASSLAGRYNVYATVYEDSGRAASRNVQLTLDNPLPALAVTSPAAYSTTRGTSVTVAGTATPGGAPIDRVYVSTQYRKASVVPAADGTWSLPWDVTDLYGTHYLTVEVRDTAGYRRTVTLYFWVERPRPTVTVVSPGTGATLNSTVPVDIVATVVPAAEARTTPAKVCFRYDYYKAAACATRQEDGRWVAPGVLLSSGSVYVTVEVTESDGYLWRYDSVARYSVYGPPPKPYNVTADSWAEDASVGIQWEPGWSPSGYTPVRAWVVRDEEGTVVAQVTSPANSVRFVPSRLGVLQSFTVEATNEYGASERVVSGAVRPAHGTYVKDVTVTPSTVTYPGKVTVRARAERFDGLPVVGQQLRVSYTPANYAGSPLVVFTPATDSGGWTTVSFAPPFIGTVNVRLVGGGMYIGSSGDGGRVNVLARVDGGYTVASIPLGRSTAFNGGVRAPMPGRGVALQRYYGGGVWRTVAWRTQDSLGRVSFVLSPTARGTYTYRLAYGGDAYRAAGVSAARNLTVY